MQSRIAPTTALSIQPRSRYQRPSQTNGRSTRLTTKPMARPIAWKMRVKNCTIGSNMALSG
jgi:hypothetical protein